MDDPGFDWLKFPTSKDARQISPAPPVSFGFTSNSDLPISNNTEKFFKNSSMDQLVMNSGRNDDSYSVEQNWDTNDELSIPLSLTAQELTLQESKTYMRWYSDILARTNSRTITMIDVFSFLNNFKISQAVKDKISKIFQKILNSINIGEFFALLRLISHCISGSEPRRQLIKIKAPVPTPPSILSKKRQNDEDHDNNEEEMVDNDNNTNSEQDNKPFDIDSFTQFILTGERPDEVRKKKRSKKSKSVKFSDQIVTNIPDDSYVGSPIGSPLPQPETLDYSLPMDQLLSKIRQPQTPQEDKEEQEVLQSMEINHFQNLNSVDSVSVNGVPAHLDFNKHGENNLLKPNMTGPAQMSKILNQKPGLLQPNMTGPAQMSRYYSMHDINDNNNENDYDNNNQYENGIANGINNISLIKPHSHEVTDSEQLFPDNSNSLPKISLQSFTNQMTSNTQNNTLQNASSNFLVAENGSPLRAADYNHRPLPPPPVPNTRRTRSVSSPIPRDAYSPKNESSLGPPTNAPTVPPRSPLSSSYIANSVTEIPSIDSSLQKIPPPPPPSRRRNTSISSPNQTPHPPLPPKIQEPSGIYSINNDSTANILDDLKALQAEVDKIRDMTGGF